MLNHFLTSKFLNNINHTTLDLLYIIYNQSTNQYSHVTRNIITSKRTMPRRKGNPNVFSSQEATQMFFIDTHNKGSDIDLADDLSNLDSDYDPEEQGIEFPTEDEDEEGKVPLKKRRKVSIEQRVPC